MEGAGETDGRTIRECPFSLVFSVLWIFLCVVVSPDGTSTVRPAFLSGQYFLRAVLHSVSSPSLSQLNPKVRLHFQAPNQ